MKFPETDQELWAYCRERFDARPSVSVAVVATELGVHTDDLVAWIMAYSEPKRDRAALRSKGSVPALVSDNMVTTHWSLSDDARRFATWRKAQAGAIAARRAIG